MSSGGFGERIDGGWAGCKPASVARGSWVVLGCWLVSGSGCDREAPAEAGGRREAEQPSTEVVGARPGAGGGGGPDAKAPTDARPATADHGETTKAATEAKAPGSAAGGEVKAGTTRAPGAAAAGTGP